MRNMQDKTCCFTGHRVILVHQRDRIYKALKIEIIKLIESGYCYFGVGGALGFDTLAAQVILELKQVYLHIKLILVLPCMEQTKGWSATDISIYEDIKNRCNKYTYTSEHYYSGCMHKRNRHLVDHSTVCIAYLTRQSGGTAFTVDYAKKHNVRVINIANYISGKEHL